MRTKEQDIFMIYFSPKMYEARLRDLNLGERKVLGLVKNTKLFTTKL